MDYSIRILSKPEMTFFEYRPLLELESIFFKANHYFPNFMFTYSTNFPFPVIINSKKSYFVIYLFKALQIIRQCSLLLQNLIENQNILDPRYNAVSRFHVRIRAISESAL